ncbi:MAG: elongation factor G [Bdellovibrionales bacterium CG12_big_fil_rev_8_21_14_0_65_38_15]|nr:MAG: elongation factor G [Bdellovibrionales bacterium CG22_combo_CG10-13_8_21_14_all_38_13]PIQ55717.1 MAG: elongation factor G [Bdellovibrionales bacterium CG12_big_fil_rev_8_21_14_0_65_38_15]PIR30727.1 MAG: elongation factor G [Bdellovibrionales bacterium CG11_big_fil_rev_8_21_14_0_20_38_13]
MKLMAKTRNIGISAHIDSGKTTLTERILYYCGTIHKIEDVRGGGDGAKMDHMELEKEKGITITSAATTVFWRGLENKGTTFAKGIDKDTRINIIDTPGHVDFTVEVERSLRVLDGAILVLCSVAGVQSQSITVDRQMKRYRVPRLSFLNKMDRMGANAFKGRDALIEKLGHNAVLMQCPIGAEDEFKGVVDLITRKAYYFDGDNGEKVRIEDCPADLVEKVEELRAEMIDKVAEFDDAIMENYLEGNEPNEEELHKCIKIGVLSLKLTPVYMGSAFKNKGVQTLLEAVARYLPSPLECEKATAINDDNGEKVALEPDPEKPLVCMAFKITDEQFGQLTYIRIYQGRLNKGDTIYNTRTKKKVRVGRIVRMNSNDRENIEECHAGDIVALIGVDCASGDTFVGDDKYTNLSCEGMHVPVAVIELSISVKDKNDQAKLSKGLQRFMKEDPTFHVFTDEESGETRIAGMGELHLEIYVERLKREYGCSVQVGAPQVNYRETIRAPETKFDYTHKKQTGGSGQFGAVIGMLKPLKEEDKASEDQVFKFNNQIKGGSIPNEFIGACEKGFQDVMDKGPLAAFPVINCEVFLQDGKYHDVDSSDMAFRIAARQAMRKAIKAANPVLLEPIMKVEVTTPDEYQGPVIGDLSSRRGAIQGSETEPGGEIVIVAEVPLSEMFGYSNDLRSMSAGKATYTMEFAKYADCPSNVQEKVLADRKEKLASDD